MRNLLGCAANSGFTFLFLFIQTQKERQDLGPDFQRHLKGFRCLKMQINPTVDPTRKGPEQVILLSPGKGRYLCIPSPICISRDLQTFENLA